MKKILLVLLLFSAQLYAQSYSGGSGTEADPYQISTLSDLITLSATSGDQGLHFIQTADIDASATSTLNPIDGGGYYGFSPIGSFTGSYDGNGYTISNLYINRGSSSYIGLFGYIYGNAEILDLGIVEANIKGNNNVGALVGKSQGITISDCYSYNSHLEGNENTGGLVGINESSGCVIEKCYSTGTVRGGKNAGGLVGFNYYGIIRNCYSAVSVTGTSTETGGFVGQNEDRVSNCYSTGDVYGNNHRVGGFIGLNDDDASVDKCYSLGAASGGISASLGLFAGQNNRNSKMTDCFCLTDDVGEEENLPVVGYVQFYSITEVIEKSDDAMNDRATFVDSSWDFVAENTEGLDHYWGIDGSLNSGYPFLTWQFYKHYSVGAGTVDSPYEIRTADDLIELSNRSEDWSKYFIQTADISFDYENAANYDWDGNGVINDTDISGFSPIGNSITYFSGSYDGNGHTISNLYINRGSTDYVGLFGYTDNAEISNLGIVEADITGGSYTGGLVGKNDNGSTINQCYSTVLVTGKDENTGGLVGSNSNSSIVNNSYSTGTVNGDAKAGGFVGANYNDAEVNKCYSVADIVTTNTSYNNVGLFAGYNYSSGKINSCFCLSDEEQNSPTVNGSGTMDVEEKSEALMNTSLTFTDAGWDATIWYRNDSYNDGYPYLSWQYVSGTPLPVELTLFTAALTNSATGEQIVVLNWETATEVNNYGFEVQKQLTVDSDQLSEWEVIGFVEGHGNSNSPKSYEYIDTDVQSGEVEYRLKQIDTDGKYEYFSTTAKVDIQITDINDNDGLPTNFVLKQNYPNPFNPATTINYRIPTVETGHAPSLQVQLIVYDLLGREVATIVNREQAAGNYSVNFDASELPSGMYIYRIQAGDFMQSRKMLLLR